MREAREQDGWEQVSPQVPLGSGSPGESCSAEQRDATASLLCTKATLLEYRCRVNRLFRLSACPSNTLFTGLFLSLDMEFNQGLHV